MAEDSAHVEPVAVHLLGTPHLRVGGQVLAVPDGCRRLLALVCLARGPIRRRTAAERLWPDVAPDLAAGRLRTALWRLRSVGPQTVLGSRSQVVLRPGVTVDVARVRAAATAVVEGHPLPGDSWSEWTAELLPGCLDEWLLLEREQLRLVVQDALETLAARLVAADRLTAALDVATAAVHADLLRESAQTALIRVHLARRDPSSALRAYRAYALRLELELGATPGPDLKSLLRGISWKSDHLVH